MNARGSVIYLSKLETLLVQLYKLLKEQTVERLRARFVCFVLFYFCFCEVKQMLANVFLEKPEMTKSGSLWNGEKCLLSGEI